MPAAPLGRERVEEPNWHAFFSTLEPTDYGAIVGKVEPESDQPRSLH